MLSDKTWAQDLGKWEKSLLLPLRSSEVLSQFRPFCAKSVCASASLPPLRSLGCESQRLEVSSPGGCKVFETCGVRWGGTFPVLACYLPTETAGFLNKVGNVLKLSLLWRSCSLHCLPRSFPSISVSVSCSPTASLRPFNNVGIGAYGWWLNGSEVLTLSAVFSLG